ncbi:UDP-glucose dehydrogenase family protein [Oceanobacillus senegalensis]|uniref:UDP-glucose dehydrogenase family protein n=1 Tax=Oceanobacillus senegalensis TaxID=1936063 RepID=UPI000A31126A|nr:UDP-glucose/GDP-mannose dehydrogenase family protein [Oceanobacillus senegalensis]
MRIAVLGTGYVGLSTGLCLADIGHEVVCIDVDEEKIGLLSNGIPTIYEPGLEPVLKENILNGRLRFTTSHEDGLKHAEIIIITVGTPQTKSGEADLSYLMQAAEDIAIHLKHDTIVVIKSTVPVGTNDKVKEILEQNKRRDVTILMGSNPEFLRQGSAINDTIYADRIVIGTDNREAALQLENMYQPLSLPILHTTIRSAEMIKYASNAFLATKISFINEIANLCEMVGADVEDVARGMGKDKRIGTAFLNAGIGYGGSCFPKDVQALVHVANEYNMRFGLLEETMSINNLQRERLVWKALSRLGHLQDKKIAMLGLSFKPETDDMREAPSIVLANALIEKGAKVFAYDPVATDNARKVIGSKIEYATTIEETVKNADALFIVTEWKEFLEMDLGKVIQYMNNPIIFDGRNCLNEVEIRKCREIEYYPIGKPCIIK